MAEADLAPRLFSDAEELHAVTRGLLARDLPRERWTHEAHLAAIVTVLVAYPEIAPERDMPVIISGYNLAVGGVNDDTQGYHETMTQTWIRIARTHIAAHPGLDLLAMANALIAGPDGAREVPLRHYSRDLLFSVRARRGFEAPDLLPLPALA